MLQPELRGGGGGGGVLLEESGGARGGGAMESLEGEEVKGCGPGVWGWGGWHEGLPWTSVLGRPGQVRRDGPRRSSEARGTGGRPAAPKRSS